MLTSASLIRYEFTIKMCARTCTHTQNKNKNKSFTKTVNFSVLISRWSCRSDGSMNCRSSRSLVACKKKQELCHWPFQHWHPPTPNLQLSHTSNVSNATIPSHMLYNIQQINGNIATIGAYKLFLWISCMACLELLKPVVVTGHA